MGPTTVAAHQGYEETLADRALEGDEPSFQALIGHNLDRVLNVCYRTCLDRDEAERVACDSLARTTRRLAELRLSGGGFGSLWLSAAAGQALDGAVRRVAEHHQGALASESPDIYCDPAAATRTADHQLLIRSAVARLHPRHRKLLALGDGSGLSCAGMAAMLGEPVRSVAASLARARLGLAGELRGGARPELAVADECATVSALFVLRDAGELGSSEEEDLARHIRSCAACAARARASTEARTAYAQWLDVAPSQAMLVRLRTLSPGGRPRAEALRLLRSSAARRIVLTSAVSASVLVIGAALALRSDSPVPGELHADVPAPADASIPEGARSAATARGDEDDQRTEDAERAQRVRDLASRGGRTGGRQLVPQPRSLSRAERERDSVRRRQAADDRALTADSERSGASEEDPTSTSRGEGLLRESVGSLIGGDRPDVVQIGRPGPAGDDENPQSGDSKERPSGGDGSDEGGRKSQTEPPAPSEDEE